MDGIANNIDTILAVALFLGGMFWSDYTKRGDRQGKQSIDLASIVSRLNAVEAAQEEHGETIKAVTRLQEQVTNMTAAMATMRDDFRRDMANIREDFRRVLDELTRPPARRGRTNA